MSSAVASGASCDSASRRSDSAARSECDGGGQTAGRGGCAFELMKRAHLAVTPGRDFGHAETARYVRFSTASSMDQLRTAVQRLQTLLA